VVVPTVQPVTTHADRKRFIEYPYRKYAGHRTWVPPLLLQEWEDTDPKKNPFFEHTEVQLFLAIEGSEVVGRVAAMNDSNYNTFHNEKTCLFAAFEAQSVEVARALMSAVEAWGRARGLVVVKGPSKISQNDMMGFLVENFDDPPTVMMNYNPPEYPAWMTDLGFSKSEDTFAWKMTVAQGLPERVGRIAKRVQKNLHVTLRSIDKKNLDRDAAIMRQIYNAAWDRNWGFVPWTEHEIDHLKDQLKQVADFKISFIAEIDGKPVAFSLVLPDINEALPGTGGRLLPFGLVKLLLLKPKRMRLLALGILPEYQGRGLDAFLYAETFWRGQGTYQAGEFGWTLESNDAINNGMRALGAEPYKRYRIFEKRL
jgi:GNAT superfamily N-acetyltransferase